MLFATAFTLFCLLGLLVAESNGAAWPRRVSKCGASAGFLWVAALNPNTWSTSAGGAIFVGLICGAIGDVLLLADDKRIFLAGLVAFLLNHVAYTVAFVLLGVSFATVGVALFLLAVVAWRVWGWLSPRTGKLKLPVLAYILIITTMVALSAGTVQAAGPVLLLGAILFFVSDLAVARQRFIERSIANKLVGLPLYYVAQLVFAGYSAAGPG